MAKEKEKVYTILIPKDEMNKDKEQFKTFQRDGVSIDVPIGKFVQVPQWVAERAKKIGLVEDFLVSEK